MRAIYWILLFGGLGFAAYFFVQWLSTHSQYVIYIVAAIVFAIMLFVLYYIIWRYQDD